MLVSNVLLDLVVFPKLLRYWWPQHPQLNGVSREIISSSHEHINTEEGSASQEYPDSIRMGEKAILAVSSHELC